MALMLTRGGVMSRWGGSSGLAHRLDVGLHREMKSVTACEISIASFGFGVIQGRFKKSGGLTLGLPVDLVAGVALHAIPMLFGFARPMAHHYHAVANGALASFFTTTGYRVGERWGSGGKLWPNLMAGIFGDEKPVAGGASIADQELASLVKAG